METLDELENAIKSPAGGSAPKNHEGIGRYSGIPKNLDNAMMALYEELKKHGENTPKGAEVAEDMAEELEDLQEDEMYSDPGSTEPRIQDPVELLVSKGFTEAEANEILGAIEEMRTPSGEGYGH